MTRVLHLSDLHYGRERAGLEEALLSAIDRLDPDLVAISGDFTQRARVSQFARARGFLDRLTQPWLAVPGNHDTPLDNLWVRMFAPWKRYRRAISPELEPRHETENMVVVGVNTVNRFAWQRGRLSERRIERACAGFAEAGERARIVVLHHPLQHGPEVEKRLMRGAGAALRRFADCGAQIVLSGHLHQTVVAPFRAHPGLLFVQAGTGLSDRLRGGERNTFNLLTLSGPRVSVETWGLEGAGFDLIGTKRYLRDGDRWERLPDAEVQAPEMVSTVRFPLV
ncbi:metallophosphoesterase family protein [Salipiger abyssi]|uniref:metallophosphoesterase family protein n=1 Tax=Salipiger abyssi TaxID=1250539 RepID=UPI001A8D0EB9|nr:metallophosphoesterase [Salipiger abyssi]MBN9886037.1 metallophosphoesterase [Salipiger abyssi]